MTRTEAIEFLQITIHCEDKGDEKDLREAMDMAIKALEQEPCEKCEAGNPCLYCKHDFEKKTEQEPCEDISDDGTLTVNVKDGRKVTRVLVCSDNHWGGLFYPDEQEPCDKCRYKRTSICGNCKEYDEFEEIDFVQEHKKIPVTLDLTPCTDAVSREDVMQILYDYDCTNENALMVKAIKALPSVNAIQHTSNASKDVEQHTNTLGDAVSREAVLQAVSEGCQEWRGIYGRCEELINALPSVNPQEPKTGHWIHFAQSDDCSECGWSTGKYISPSKFCPNCGVRMESAE